MSGSTGLLEAYHGIKTIEGVVPITGNGATVINVFKFTGAVRIIHQEAMIYSVVDITTCSSVYATVYDGTNTKDLTNSGIDLSGVPVGTYFVKDKVLAESYSLVNASEVCVHEVSNTVKAGLSFTVVGKAGVDSYIQFRFTGDINTNFNMFVKFDYLLVNGSTLELA